MLKLSKNNSQYILHIYSKINKNKVNISYGVYSDENAEIFVSNNKKYESNFFIDEKNKYFQDEQKRLLRQKKDINEKSIIRAKNLIMEYSQNNDFNFFVTFTFDKRKVKTDNEFIKNKILKSLDNFKQSVDKEFKYLLIPELHKNGQIHFHGLFYLSDLGQKNMTKLFTDEKTKHDVYRHDYFFIKYGANRFIKIEDNDIETIEKISFYVSKYISKDLLKQKDRHGFSYKHLYYCSNGLKRNETIFISDNISYAAALDFVSKKIAYTDFVLKENETKYNIISREYTTTLYFSRKNSISKCQIFLKSVLDFYLENERNIKKWQYAVKNEYTYSATRLTTHTERQKKKKEPFFDNEKITAFDIL